MTGLANIAKVDVKVTDSNTFFGAVNAISSDAVSILRFYLQDQPEYNRLIEGEEFTDTELRFAIAKGVSDINSMAPVGMASLPGIPLGLFVAFSSFAALEMSCHRRLRNDIANYSEGGTAVDTEKYEKVFQHMQNQRNFYYEQMKKYKMYQNLGQIGGSLPSAYLFEYVRIM